MKKLFIILSTVLLFVSCATTSNSIKKSNLGFYENEYTFFDDVDTRVAGKTLEYDYYRITDIHDINEVFCAYKEYLWDSYKEIEPTFIENNTLLSKSVKNKMEELDCNIACLNNGETDCGAFNIRNADGTYSSFIFIRNAKDKQ